MVGHRGAERGVARAAARGRDGGRGVPRARAVPAQLLQHHVHHVLPPARRQVRPLLVHRRGRQALPARLAGRQLREASVSQLTFATLGFVTSDKTEYLMILCLLPQLFVRKAATRPTAVATVLATASELNLLSFNRHCNFFARILHNGALSRSAAAGPDGAGNCAPSASRTLAANMATATGPPGIAPATPTGAEFSATKVGTRLIVLVFGNHYYFIVCS